MMRHAPEHDDLDHPNLLLVGFVKCGTTSLAKYLTDHPGIAAPVAKELYYLIDKEAGLKSMQPIIDALAFKDPGKVGAREYIEFFPERKGCRYALDATPFYYSQEAALRYSEEHVNVSVIFMLRNPATRLYSSFQYFQNVFQEYPRGSFEEFVDALLDHGALRARYRENIKKPFFRNLFDDELDMGNYEKHITKWVNAVGRERIFLGKLEDVEEDPRNFMKILCGFLNLDAGMYDRYQFQSYMRSYRVRIPLLQAVARRIGREDPIRYDRMREFQSPFHRVPFAWLRNMLDDAYGKIQRKNAPQGISAGTLRRISEYYEPANSLLKAKYGIDYTLPGGSRKTAEPAMSDGRKSLGVPS